VIAYRGTLAPGGPNPREILDDWVNNAQTRMVRRPDFGDVHDGFYDSHHALWDDVKAGIAKRLNPTPPAAIIVTGHSKGGALAVLGASAIRRTWKNLPVHVVTFAAPRAGGRTFADLYKTLGIPTLRYENRADLVPYLPLGETPQPFVRTLLKAIHAKSPVTGYVAVGDALVAGPGVAEVSLDWIGLAFTLFRTSSLARAIPLIAAHDIDSGVYPTMANEQSGRCAQRRHAECLAALG
jgi:hypothetical protein